MKYNKRYSMETLKVKINKEKFVEIESGKNELVIGFTQALLKKISKDKSYTISDLISNKELIKHFDELCILCMFSSDMITLPIEEMSVEEDGIHFILKNEKENVQTDEDKQNEGDKTPEPEDNGDETPEPEDSDDETNISERINKEIEEFCKNNRWLLSFGYCKIWANRRRNRFRKRTSYRYWI